MAKLNRTASGLLHVSIANDGTHPFSLVDWEEQFGVDSLTIDGTTGGLDLTVVADGVAFARLTDSGSRSARMVQVVAESVNSSIPGIMSGGHFETGSTGNQCVGIYDTVNRNSVGADEFHRAREREGESSLVTDSVVVTDRSPNTQYRFSVDLDGSACSTYDFLEADTRSITTTTFTSGHAGIGADSFSGDALDVRWHEFWDCADNVVTCDGLPTGYKLKVRNSGATVLKSATESSGTATLDLFDVNLANIEDIVVTNATDTVQATFTPSSGDYVAGGDTYQFVLEVAAADGADAGDSATATVSTGVDGGIDGWSASTNYLTTSTPIITSRPLMISCWGYLTAATGTTGNWAMAIGQDGVFNHGREMFVRRVDGDDNFAVREKDGSTTASAETALDTAPVGSWFHMAGAFVSATLREAWIDGGNKASNTTSITPNAPDSTFFGVSTQGLGEWGEGDAGGDGGALCEFSAWDLTGFSETDRNNLVAELSTLVDGRARNPIDIDADVSEAWSGALVFYVRGEGHTDLDDRAGTNDLSTVGTLTTFGNHAPVDALSAIVTLTDGADSGDSASAAITIPVIASDGSEAGEVLSVTLIFVVDASDGADAGDSVTATLDIVTSASDGAEAGDSVVSALTIPASAIDGMVASDDGTMVMTIPASLVDGATPGDSATASVQAGVPGFSTLTIRFT